MMHPSVAVALGGGGARGIAHLGVLEVLHDAGIRPSRYFGVSIGSIVGALVAFEPDIHVVCEQALKYLLSPAFQKYSAGLGGGPSQGLGDDDSHVHHHGWFDKFRDYIRANRTFHRMILGSSLLPGRILEEVVNSLVPDADVADAKVPLTIVAVDLITGREVEITRGPLRRAVLGSASLPGIFPPVEYGGCLLADIGVVSAVPSHAARRSGVERVIAIDVTHHPQRKRAFPSAIDVMLRLEDVASSLFLNVVLQHADVVIQPDVSRLEWSDFSRIEATIVKGREAAHAALPRVCGALGVEYMPPSRVPDATGGD